MADDPWKRFREKNVKPFKKPGATSAPKEAAPLGSSKRVREEFQDVHQLLEELPPLIEQLNNLYNMFIAGVEKRPPVERRKFLENQIQRLINMPKTSSTLKFKTQAVVNQATTHMERWDKLIRKIEVGALKRRLAAK